MLLSKAKNAKMQEVKNFIPISTSSDFDTLMPHIANAERDYLIPVIGQKVYDELQAFYDGTEIGSSGTDEKLEELLPLVQSAVLHIAYWIGYDLLNVEVSDSGFKRTESDTVKGLYKYQDENLKAYFRTNGFNGLDTVLKYLEENIADFPKFKTSASYTVMKGSFIPDTVTFDQFIFINKSRLTFLRMKPHMQLIEDADIAPILGPITYAYIKEEMLKDSPSTKVTGLLNYIRKPIAYLASALLMEESGADLKDNGLYFDSTIAISNNDTQRNPSSAERIQILVNRNRAFGNAYLDQLRSYLVTHAADWNDVTLSTGKALRRDNTDKKTFWA